jgi:hypothetical protein
VSSGQFAKCGVFSHDKGFSVRITVQYLLSDLTGSVGALRNLCTRMNNVIQNNKEGSGIMFSSARLRLFERRLLSGFLSTPVAVVSLGIYRRGTELKTVSRAIVFNEYVPLELIITHGVSTRGTEHKVDEFVNKEVAQELRKLGLIEGVPIEVIISH